jgi:hypothetical protein
MAVHKDCYSAIDSTQQDGPHRRETNFQVSPQVLSQRGKPNAIAVKAARFLGQHVSQEQLRRRARLIQHLTQTAGPLIGVAVTAVGSLYAGLKGFWDD